MSFLVTPIAFTLAMRTTWHLPHAAYAFMIWGSAMPIWLLVWQRATDYGKHPYSLWGLRGQLWLHIGGGLRQALQRLR